MAKTKWYQSRMIQAAIITGVFVIVAGICFLMLALPDCIQGLKTIFRGFKKGG